MPEITKNPKKFKLGLRIMIYAVIGYTSWCMLLYFVQDGMLFPRFHIPFIENSKPPVEATQVWVENDGDKTEGWYLPPLKGTPPYPVVVFFHGNAELIDFCQDSIEQYRKWGMAVLLPEYRGYGRSQGDPGQQNIGKDMRKFYNWLQKHKDIDSDRIIYHGRSLGGGVACQLAADHPPTALILQSTFTSVVSMSRGYLVPSVFVKHPFRNDKVIKSLQIPIFITHGSHDEIIPVIHGRRLHKVAKNSVYFEVPSGHNDYPMNKKFWQTIQEFLVTHNILKQNK